MGSYVSWKSVEMQVALPRTQDAGQLQEQLSKQNQRFQETLAQHQLKDEIIKRRQVREFEETVGKKIMREDADAQGKNQAKDQQNQQKAKEETKKNLTHPYLGQHIDLSR